MCKKNDIAENFDTIQKLLEEEAKAIIEAVKATSLENICFKYLEKIEVKDEDSLKNGKGIYIFYNKEGISVSDRDKFNDVKYGAKIDSKQNMKISHNVIYLGKSNNLFKRIKEHRSRDDKLPYSLKINNKNRKELKNGLEIFIFKIRKEYEKYSNIILGTIESYLHDNMEPFVGSRRI